MLRRDTVRWMPKFDRERVLSGEWGGEHVPSPLPPAEEPFMWLSERCLRLRLICVL